MADTVTAALAGIESALVRLQRRTLLQALRLGLSAGEVQTTLGEIGLRALPELQEMYAWRNGTSTAGLAAVDGIHVLPGFYMLPLDDVVANYRTFTRSPRWNTGWLPLFANGGGDFYLVDLSLPEHAPVRHFRIEEPTHPIEFDSIGDMLRTLAAAFERGIFYVDGDHHLEMDDRDFSALAAQLNPNVLWWQ